MSEKDELKREIEQLKKQNESLTKLLAKVYKKLGIEELEEKNKEKVKEKDIVGEIEEEIEIPIEGLDYEDEITKEDFEEDTIEREDHEVEEEEEVSLPYISHEKDVKKEIKQLLKHINAELKKVMKKIDKETEQIRNTTVLSERIYDELHGDIEILREQLRTIKFEFKKAQRALWRAMKEAAKKKEKMSKRSVAFEEWQLTEKELEKLRDKIEESKELLKEATKGFVRLVKRVHVLKKGQKGRKAEIYVTGEVNLGEIIGQYIEGIVGSAMRNLEETLKSVTPYQWKKEKKMHRKDDVTIEEIIKIDEDSLPEFLEKASLLFFALGDKNRLKLLKVLEKGPEFQKELSEKTGLKGGAFKHHTDILKDAKYITREAVRGRYLITRLGFEAVKLAELLYKRYQQFIEEENSYKEEED